MITYLRALAALLVTWPVLVLDARKNPLSQSTEADVWWRNPITVDLPLAAGRGEIFGGPLGESEVQIFDRLVDFRRVLVADGDAIHAGVLESVPHGSLAVLAIGE